jgi:homoserine dehydrogenase
LKTFGDEETIHPLFNNYWFMNKKQINIGLFGFGCVGQGLYSVLNETRGLKAEIRKICIKNEYKTRPIDKSLFTTNKDTILKDDNINVIVELIDDADAAYLIVKEALMNRKAVVTANKKMVARHLKELLELQAEYKTPILYESACCASIPIIRNLEEYYDNDLLFAIEGIFNGTCNFILTNQLDQKFSFEISLLKAQEKGFAESNPHLDISGEDTRNKLCIMIAHAFGLILNPEDIFCRGISEISNSEIRYASEKGYSIKLVATARKIGDKVFAIVAPRFIRKEDKLADVRNEYNGVIVETAFAEQQFFSGKGAGSYPTGSAVLSDISALCYNYRYEYKKIDQGSIPKFTNQISLQVYLRFDSSISLTLKSLLIDELYQNRTETTILGKVSLEELIHIQIPPKMLCLMLQPDPFDSNTIKREAYPSFAKLSQLEIN